MVVKPTWNTAVVHLLAPCLLKSMLHGWRDGLDCQVTARIDDISSISAKLISQGSECGLVELQFWLASKPEKPVFESLVVHMPPFWTPKMYLAAVFSSIRYKKISSSLKLHHPWMEGKKSLPLMMSAHCTSCSKMSRKLNAWSGLVGFVYLLENMNQNKIKLTIWLCQSIFGI